MRKILVIGAGGIGSFLIPLLDKVSLYNVTVADPDKVEAKNLTYQNFKKKELTTLTTRIGEDTKLIIGGDFMQSDINGKTGFKDFFNIFNDDESKEMGIHTFSFTTRDIVRSEILKFIIKRLDIK